MNMVSTYRKPVFNRLGLAVLIAVFTFAQVGAVFAACCCDSGTDETSTLPAPIETAVTHADSCCSEDAKAVTQIQSAACVCAEMKESKGVTGIYTISAVVRNTSTVSYAIPELAESSFSLDSIQSTAPVGIEFSEVPFCVPIYVSVSSYLI
jgi:hypothetical protein